MLNIYYKIASEIHNKVEREVLDMQLVSQPLGGRECKVDAFKYDIDEFRRKALDKQRKLHKEKLDIAFIIMSDTTKHIAESTMRTCHFITLRPKPETNFITFYDKVSKLMERKIFGDFKLSFEQKGESDETLGTGFHCHIIVTLSVQAQKKGIAELVRDIASTMNGVNKESMITHNNIDIRKTQNPDDIVKNYLIEYNSKDDHKIKTKIWDQKWRESLGLKPLYGCNELLPPQQAREVVVENVRTVLTLT